MSNMSNTQYGPRATTPVHADHEWVAVSPTLGMMSPLGVVLPLSSKAHAPIRPATVGFLSPLLALRDRLPGRAAWWNEFWGSFWFAFTGRLFAAFFGGSVLAATIPTLYGTAFVNAFGYFMVMATFGAVSGGHFNASITLCIMIIELAVRWGWFGDFHFAPGSRPWRSWWGLLPYFVAQFIGFILAALLVWAFLPGTPLAAPIELGIPFVSGVVSDGKTFGLEIVASFGYLTVYVVLMKMFGGSTMWMSHAIRSLVFGFSYFALFLVFAPWAGALWNPTLWLAFAIISGRWVDWWILFWPAFISSFAAAAFCFVHWWISQPDAVKVKPKV